MIRWRASRSASERRRPASSRVEAASAAASWQRVLEQGRGLLAGLAHGEVGGALGQHERAAQALVVKVRALGVLRLLADRAQLGLEVVDRDGDPFQELVDLVGVVPAQSRDELHVAQDLSGYFHVSMVRGQ